jgi:hypothetical protein
MPTNYGWSRDLMGVAVMRTIDLDANISTILTLFSEHSSEPLSPDQSG